MACNAACTGYFCSHTGGHCGVAKRTCRAAEGWEERNEGEDGADVIQSHYYSFKKLFCSLLKPLLLVPLYQHRLACFEYACMPALHCM